MGKLFRSKRQRDKDAKKERRRAFRDAGNAIDSVKDRIRDMDREARKEWEQAREELKAGRRAAAQRMLTSYRAAQVLMTKLEQKRWVFEQYVMKMETAQTDTEFAGALESINRIVEVDPDRVADVFDASQDLLGEQLDADRFWNKLYDKEMDGASGALEDYIPSVEDMNSQLEEEAAAEVGGGTAERVSGALDERITSGQDRVRKLLDDK